MPLLTIPFASMITRISPKRVFNVLLIYTSYQLSRIFGFNLIMGMPISLAVEPTTACNLRCPECPSGLRSFTRPTGNLQSEPFKELIDQIADHTTYLTFYFQGEPYLNPNFLDMVQYASGKKMITSTSTNAHFLDDAMAERTIRSGLDRLIISIDGTDQNTYEAYRKEGSLEKVIEGTKNIIKWKKKLSSDKPYVVFQFLVVAPNEHQVEEVQELGNELGVDEVVLKTAQIYDFENGNELIPKNSKYSRYALGKNGKYRIKNELKNQCWRMWSSCVVTWDGQVVPCCFDKDAQHTVGDLKNTTFKEIWQGNAYQNFRKAILKGRDQIDICKNCSEGTKVWT